VKSDSVGLVPRIASAKGKFMNADIHPPDMSLSFGLAFVGGYCDAAGFLLAKTFTGHITGSLVLGAITMAARDWRGALAHFSSTACFLTGVPLSVLIARFASVWPSWPMLGIAMGIEIILIVASYLALAFHRASAVEIFIVCLSLALGLQNGAFRRTGGISVHTTYLTGMITDLIANKAENVTFQMTPRRTTALDPKIGLLWGLWAVFVLGAAAGAVAVFHFNAAGILGAAFVLLAMIVRNSLVALRTQPAN
jgi:uncharacterized membrane protein YoaK (UPF0700 family)